MGLKRTDKDGYFDYLTDEEEAMELSRIMEEAIDKAERICDLFYKGDDTKAIAEEAWLKLRLRELRYKTHSVDTYKQEIKLLFSSYNK